MNTLFNATGACTPYAKAFKSWPKGAGEKPAGDLLATAHAFGRPGKQSLALAMAMREAGTTASQILLACGAPQNNHRRAVIEKGYFSKVPMAFAENGHTVYRIALTKRGEAAKAKAIAAAEAPAKPAKAKAKVKAKRAAKPAAPVTEAAPVTPAEAPVITDTPVTA